MVALVVVHFGLVGCVKHTKIRGYWCISCTLHFKMYHYRCVRLRSSLTIWLAAKKVSHWYGPRFLISA